MVGNILKADAVEKGLMVVIVVGAIFGYFVLSLFNTSSSEDDSKWASSSSRNVYDSYYEKDVLGDKVLNLNKLDISKAKSIWAGTLEAASLSEIVPDFDLAIAEAKNSLADGTFKTYILNYISKLQEQYAAGEISTEKAKELIKNLK